MCYSNLLLILLIIDLSFMYLYYQLNKIIYPNHFFDDPKPENPINAAISSF